MMAPSLMGRSSVFTTGWSSIACLLLIFLSVTCRPGELMAQDAVAGWLKTRGLDRLRMARLEEMLSSTRIEEEQDVLIGQLIELYVRGFDSNMEDEERALLEERGRRVLKSLKIKTGDPLRLVLLRSRYALAEAECLKIRLERVGASDRESMILRLDALGEELGELRLRLEKRNESQKKRLGRTRGIDAQLMSRETVTLDVMLGQATYLEAWVRAYLGWLSNSFEESALAQRLFGKLFDTGETYPEPPSLSVDRRSFDWYAWSIIGTAFARSLTDSMPTLDGWLDLLENEEAAERPRAWLPFWRLALALDLRDYRVATRILNDDPDEASPEMLRHASIVALQAVNDPEASELARIAVDLLASRGDFAQISELSDRFGLPDVKEGFLLRFVGAWQLMREAEVIATAGDQVAARELNRMALSELIAADTEPDALKFPELRIELLKMRGLCHRLTGDHLSAGEDFLTASEDSGGPNAGDLLWSAIQSFLEHERKQQATEDEIRLRSELIDRFLVFYPSHPSVSRARLLQMEDRVDPTIDDALALLAFSEKDDLADIARKKALRILYGLFKSGAGTTSADAGRLFLERVPSPAFSFDMTDGEVDAALLEAFRILSVSLAERTRDRESALELMRMIDSARREGMEIPVRHRNQLASRRIEVLLLPPLDVDNLLEVLAKIESKPRTDTDPYFKRSLKMILATAGRALLEEPRESPLIPVSIHAIRRAGALLMGTSPMESDLSDPEQWLILRTMALAEKQAYSVNGDFEAGEKAFAFYSALVQSRPKDIRSLNGLVTMGQATGRLEQAIDAQRVLLNGASPGTNTFYERKLLFLELLSRHDPDRARKVLAQHVVLYPEYGPDEWGVRIRALHQSLGGGDG
jgi:hypothetical protein